MNEGRGCCILAAQERINRISLDRLASASGAVVGMAERGGGGTPGGGVGGTRHGEETSGAPSGECLVSVEPCVASR